MSYARICSHDGDGCPPGVYYCYTVSIRYGCINKINGYAIGRESKMYIRTIIHHSSSENSVKCVIIQLFPIICPFFQWLSAQHLLLPQGLACWGVHFSFSFWTFMFFLCLHYSMNFSVCFCFHIYSLNDWLSEQKCTFASIWKMSYQLPAYVLLHRVMQYRENTRVCYDFT